MFVSILFLRNKTTSSCSKLEEVAINVHEDTCTRVLTSLHLLHGSKEKLTTLSVCFIFSVRFVLLQGAFACGKDSA